MIFPLATKSAFSLDTSESREMVENCYVEINEKDSETTSSIRFREGIKRVEASIIGRDDLLAAIPVAPKFGSNKESTTSGSVAVLTNKSLVLYADYTIGVHGRVDFDEPINAYQTGGLALVGDRRFVITTRGKLMYLDLNFANAASEYYDESFLKGASAVEYLRGYTIVAVFDKLYVSDFQEPKVFRALSYLQIQSNATAMIVYNDELWVFFLDGIQVYTLSGGTTVAITPVVSAHYEYDFISPQPVIYKEALYFIDKAFNIYKVQGYSFQTISPPGIKRRISEEGSSFTRFYSDYVLPRLFVSEVEQRNHAALCVAYGDGSNVVAMNMDNGLWRVETFKNEAGEPRLTVGGVKGHWLMTDGVYFRSNAFFRDDGAPIKYRLISPDFHRERELRRINVIGFKFGTSLKYKQAVKGIKARLTVHKGTKEKVIEREFEVFADEEQRNRIYRLGSSRSMSVELEIDIEGRGLAVGRLILSGAEAL